MKNPQDNANALPALLRIADGVYTLETNSLCCAAAGIVASSSATAEALIPHEKLRGAALADATLNAQQRPLAQPAVGYTHLLGNVNPAPNPAEQPESAKDRWPPLDLCTICDKCNKSRAMATTKNAASSAKPKASLGALGR